MHLLRNGAYNVFVATGYKQKNDARGLMGELRARGHDIMTDWTEASGLSREQMALRDVRGMFGADVLVALMTLPDYEYKGTFTEFGMAVGRQIPIILISPFAEPDTTGAVCAKNVYWALPNMERYKSVQAFLEALDKK